MKILKFETSQCTPCKMVDRMLKDMGLEVDEKIDIELDDITREKYNVMKSPTIMLIDDNGEEVDRVIGIDQEGIIRIFEKAKKQ